MPPVILCYDGSPDAAVAIERTAELFPDRQAVVLAVWPRAHTQFACGIKSFVLGSVSSAVVHHGVPVAVADAPVEAGQAA